MDYSDDILNISEAFMTENNVRFIVQLFPEGQEEGKRILYKDRRGEQSQGTYSVSNV